MFSQCPTLSHFNCILQLLAGYYLLLINIHRPFNSYQIPFLGWREASLQYEGVYTMLPKEMISFTNSIFLLVLKFHYDIIYCTVHDFLMVFFKNILALLLLVPPLLAGQPVEVEAAVTSFRKNREKQTNTLNIKSNPSYSSLSQLYSTLCWSHIKFSQNTCTLLANL